MPGDRTTPRDEHGNSSPRPQSALLDIGQPKRWRRLVPRGLRSLFWSDSARRYDAFLSYSRKSDSSVAPVIQSALQRFLRPWYKVRAKTIFQHLSCLPAGSNLEAELFDRLDRSHHLILLASPDAARSQGASGSKSLVQPTERRPRTGNRHERIGPVLALHTRSPVAASDSDEPNVRL